jgi:tetratricopeptide (TPR) repeat protein
VIGPDQAPYPGLRPFGREESHLFFGRDECIDDMLARLAAMRFLAVLGSSGTGKSSLVKTGLLSALEMGRLSGACPRWRIVDFKPGGSPLRNLAAELLQTEKSDPAGGPPDQAAVDALRARLVQGGPRALIEWCREGNLAPDTNLLLLVDQFEELFRYQDYDSRQGAEAFVSLLLESRSPIEVEHPTQAEFPIYVAITMRSEYLGACSLIQGLAEAINEGAFLTPRMKRREVEEAIVGPARVCGIEVEPRLVTRLLNDMADFAPWDEADSKDQLSRLARRADQLPLMQHALNRMWWRARQQCKEGEEITLRLADYRGLERELDEHAEQVLASLDATVKPTAERVFRAVTFGTTAADAVRRPTKYGDLVKICGPENGDAVAEVVAGFGPCGCQFLTSDVRQTGERLPDDAWIDIAHESLIRQWKTLSDWLEKEGRAANEWRLLKARAERKEVLHGRGLFDAIKFQKSTSIGAWAERYGGGLDKVDRLIKRSWWRLALSLSAVAAALAVVSVISFALYQKSQQATLAARTASHNFKLTVSAAQKLLNQVSESLDHGNLSVRGANDMLKAAGGMVEDAHDMEKTIDTIELSIRLQYSVSDIYATLGNIPLALENARTARGYAEHLQSTDPANPKVMQLLYGSIWRIGDAISYQGADGGTQKQALATYREAEGLAHRLAEKAPADGARQRELMFIHQKIGDVHQALDDPDAAIAEYRTALANIRNAVDNSPENRSWRRDSANARRRIGQALGAKGDFGDAIDQLNAALEILTGLAAQDLTDNITQSNLAATHRDIAEVYAHRQDFDNALAEYRLAVEIQERLVAADRDNATWRFSLASFYSGMGAILRRQGDLPGALDRFRAAHRLRQELASNDPNNPGRQNSLAKAAIALADTLVAQKESLEEAVQLYRDAIATQDEARPRYDRDVFSCYIKIGDIRLSQEDREDALTEYTRAWAIARDGATANAGSLIWQTNLMTSYIRIGDLLAAEERTAEARDQYQQALDIVTALAEKNPKSTEWPALVESLKTKILALRA